MTTSRLYEGRQRSASHTSRTLTSACVCLFFDTHTQHTHTHTHTHTPHVCVSVKCVMKKKSKNLHNFDGILMKQYGSKNEQNGECLHVPHAGCGAHHHTLMRVTPPSRDSANKTAQTNTHTHTHTHTHIHTHSIHSSF